MTYREKYAQTVHGGLPPEEAHRNCPDIFESVVPCDGSFKCPFPNRQDGDCAACWDRQIPGTESVKPVPVPDSVILTVTKQDDRMRCNLLDCEPEDYLYAALVAVHCVAKSFYDVLREEDPVVAEKAVRYMQHALRPTGSIWDFSEKEGE